MGISIRRRLQSEPSGKKWRRKKSHVYKKRSIVPVEMR
jgi:hypothetical protein